MGSGQLVLLAGLWKRLPRLNAIFFRDWIQMSFKKVKAARTSVLSVLHVLPSEGLGRPWQSGERSADDTAV